ncbi:MAG: hypothetical protein JXJ04_07205 [Spirochaetales bacterium]|nr:hypothetical protein [Spirochaetales bacterium]
MNLKEKIKRKAMTILLHSTYGVTYEEWCHLVKEQLIDSDLSVIQKEISSLIRNHWKVQYLDIEDRGRIYVHLDLLK